MLLAIVPILAAALVVTAVLGVTLLVSPRGGRDTPGDVVDIEFLDGHPEWVVKVYADVSKLFEVQVLHAGEFLKRKRGFASIEAARGWGLNYARERA